jgi:DnaK suppressor protein
MTYDSLLEGTRAGSEDVRMLVKELICERDRLVERMQETAGLELAASADIFEPSDLGDASTVQRDVDRLGALAERAARQLDAIQRALDRAARGLFTICEECDEEIPVERLRALPETTVCTDCARELEAEARRAS